MNPITVRATEIMVLQYHAQEVAKVLSRLDQGLLLCGGNPEAHLIRDSLVGHLRTTHGRIGILTGAKVLVNADQYKDNRGLTP
jgi:hypothetical protein